MKKLFTVAFMVIGLCLSAKAQENSVNNGLGFGFQLVEYQRDFGFGLNVTSPYFFKNQVAVRLRSNAMYLEHVKDGETDWTPYTNLTFGVIGVGGYVAESIRLYGEGGVICLLPSSKFSGKSTAFGGYGLFGFEFFMEKNINYFIEIGSVGTGATADRLPFKPIYSNGLAVSTGFRVVLP